MSRAIVFCLTLFLLGGCASSGPDSGPNEQQSVEHSTQVYDPWERFNRGVYRFNARFDENIHYPLARTYRQITPAPVRTGIGNFFSNLGEIRNTANHLLQARPDRSMLSAGRFLINSTAGLLGLFDVASHIGFPQAETGFGDTLGRWGVTAGPYLVLPVLGPSSVRDGVGTATDFTLDRTVDIGGLYSGDAAWPHAIVYSIDERSRLDFRYYQTGSPFEYELVRFLYTRKRAIETQGNGEAAQTSEPVAEHGFPNAHTTDSADLVD